MILLQVMFPNSLPKIKKEMSPSCPISTRRVDLNMVRVISFQVALFTVTLLFTQEILLAVVLLFDFSMRVVRKLNLSPFHLISKFILEHWNVTPKLCDESPKRFALYMGLIISLALVLLLTAGLSKIATIIALVLLLCSLLETLFDYCIGCKIYYVIQRIKGLIHNDRNPH